MNIKKLTQHSERMALARSIGELRRGKLKATDCRPLRLSTDITYVLAAIAA